MFARAVTRRQSKRFSNLFPLPRWEIINLISFYLTTNVSLEISLGRLAGMDQLDPFFFLQLSTVLIYKRKTIVPSEQTAWRSFCHCTFFLIRWRGKIDFSPYLVRDCCAMSGWLTELPLHGFSCIDSPVQVSMAYVRRC